MNSPKYNQVMSDFENISRKNAIDFFDYKVLRYHNKNSKAGKKILLYSIIEILATYNLEVTFIEAVNFKF